MKPILNLQSDYSKNGGYIQLSLPINTECLIPVDDSVRLIDQVLEELDYRELYLTYSSEGRNPAVSPKTLFKIMVYAYSQHIYSSREIEKACRLNLAFMFLLKGEKVPDHNTISRFRKHHLTPCVEGLLTQLVDLLSDAGEISFENLFIDGTKIEANANRYSFVWRGAVEKNEAKLKDKASIYLKDELGIEQPQERISSGYLQTVLSDLLLIAQSNGVEFVHGIGKRKTSIQKQIETIEDYKSRLQKYETSNVIFKGRNSYSKTDKDATFMHMKEDYMRNGQLKPGYNIQAAVESEYIVGIDVSSERSDVRTLIPFLDKLNKSYGRNFENLIADKEIFALDKISKYAMYNIYDTPFAQYAIDRKDYPYDPLYVSEYEGEESFELDRFKVQFVIVDVYGLRYEYEFLMETKDRRNFHDAFVSRCKGIDFTSNAVLEGTFEDDYLITERI